MKKRTLEEVLRIVAAALEAEEVPPPIWSGDGYQHLDKLREEIVYDCQCLAGNVGNNVLISTAAIEKFSHRVRRNAKKLNRLLAEADETG
ncbi:MAG: hypothetical protein HN396_04415 [Gemmatimonadales bacterium]|jgi:hypothetical protein|nr:hypothetical protein [Gemmatimonadales bacterium]